MWRLSVMLTLAGTKSPCPPPKHSDQKSLLGQCLVALHKQHLQESWAMATSIVLPERFPLTPGCRPPPGPLRGLLCREAVLMATRPLRLAETRLEKLKIANCNGETFREPSVTARSALSAQHCRCQRKYAAAQRQEDKRQHVNWIIESLQVWRTPTEVFHWHNR